MLIKKRFEENLYNDFVDSETAYVDDFLEQVSKWYNIYFSIYYLHTFLACTALC